MPEKTIKILINNAKSYEKLVEIYHENKNTMTEEEIDVLLNKVKKYKKKNDSDVKQDFNDVIELFIKKDLEKSNTKKARNYASFFHICASLVIGNPVEKLKVLSEFMPYIKDANYKDCNSVLNGLLFCKLDASHLTKEIFKRFCNDFLKQKRNKNIKKQYLKEDAKNCFIALNACGHLKIYDKDLQKEILKIFTSELVLKEANYLDCQMVLVACVYLNLKIEDNVLKSIISQAKLTLPLKIESPKDFHEVVKLVWAVAFLSPEHLKKGKIPDLIKEIVDYISLSQSRIDFLHFSEIWEIFQILKMQNSFLYEDELNKYVEKKLIELNTKRHLPLKDNAVGEVNQRMSAVFKGAKIENNVYQGPYRLQTKITTTQNEIIDLEIKAKDNSMDSEWDIDEQRRDSILESNFNYYVLRFSIEEWQKLTRENFISKFENKKKEILLINKIEKENKETPKNEIEKFPENAIEKRSNQWNISDKPYTLFSSSGEHTLFDKNLSSYEEKQKDKKNLSLNSLFSQNKKQETYSKDSKLERNDFYDIHKKAEESFMDKFGNAKK